MSEILKRGVNVAGNYVFLPYDPKAPIVEVDCRTVKVMYKTAVVGASAGVKRGVNSCLLITPVSSNMLQDELLADNNRLLPHIISMCEKVQDKIAKELHLTGVTEVTDAQLDIEAIISKLDVDAASGRMNKEVIQTWFTETVAESMSVLFADKLGVGEQPTTEDTAKVMRFVEVYKNRFAGLASNLTTYPVEEATKLKEALVKCEVTDTDMIGNKLKDKLEKMINPTTTEELMSFL